MGAKKNKQKKNTQPQRINRTLFDALNQPGCLKCATSRAVMSEDVSRFRDETPQRRLCSRPGLYLNPPCLIHCQRSSFHTRRCYRRGRVTCPRPALQLNEVKCLSATGRGRPELAGRRSPTAPPLWTGGWRGGDVTRIGLRSRSYLWSWYKIISVFWSLSDWWFPSITSIKHVRGPICFLVFRLPADELCMAD